jgi:hypothetical protein
MAPNVKRSWAAVMSMNIRGLMIGCGLVVVASALMPETAMAQTQEQTPLIGTWRMEMPGPYGLELIVFCNALSATEDYAVEIFASADEFLARVPHIFVVSTFFKD